MRAVLYRQIQTGAEGEIGVYQQIRTLALVVHILPVVVKIPVISLKTPKKYLINSIMMKHFYSFSENVFNLS